MMNSQDNGKFWLLANTNTTFIAQGGKKYG